MAMSERNTGLILSYSPISTDPRVLKQIEWVTGTGTRLVVIGCGNFNKNSSLIEYVEISIPNLLKRVSRYLFTSNKARSNLFFQSTFSEELIVELENGKFSFILMNDLDFLGFDKVFQAAEKSGTKIFLDLHEFFPDLGGGILWRLFQSRYYKWLLNKVSERCFEKIFTVSDGIGYLYEKFLQIQTTTILNIPAAEAIKFDKKHLNKSVKTLAIVHHGIASRGRGITRAMRALTYTKSKIILNLVLVASPARLMWLKTLAVIWGLRKKVVFHNPVPVNEIVKMLNTFDAEIIFFHPPNSRSIHYSLPNKFFEAVQASLALIVGPSPTMSEIVKNQSLGWVTPGWSASDLASTIDSINPDSLVAARESASRAQKAYRPENERIKLLKSLGLI